MSDNITALYESDESSLEQPIVPATSRSFYIQWARFISLLLSPVTVCIPFVLLVAFYHANVNALLFAAVTLLFLAVGPLAYIVIGVSLGKFTDIDVSVRSQRTGPYLFSIVSNLLGIAVLTMLNGPKNLNTVLIIAVISNTFMMVTTFWWKISMHASGISGAVTMLALLYGLTVLPAFALIPLVAWSRIALKRHTLAQVSAGAFQSIALTVLIFLLRGA